MRSLFACCRWQPARRRFLQHFRRLRVETLEGRLAPAILTVNSLVDGPINLTDSTVTLRDAIQAANFDLQVAPGGPTGSGADEIRFQAGLSGTVLLNQDQLGLRSDLTITGPGANLLSIDGDKVTRIFDVSDLAATVRTVVISGLTISGGSAAFGAGLINRENLTLQNCVVNQNTATFVSNSGENGGGGIYNTGTLVVISSTISNNLMNDYDGGGIFNNGGTMTVVGSTISGNTSGFGNNGLGGGGGISSNSSGSLTIENSTLSGNFAKENGGGVNIVGTGSATIRNSTITQNKVNTGFGGGLASTTVVPVVFNTIIANNQQVTSISVPTDVSGMLDPASANNIFSDSSVAGITNGVNGDQTGTDPLLGPLANNGGPTLTHALLPCSPAINAGNNSQAPLGITTDQRGGSFARIAGAAVDIGAFEFQTASLVVDTNADEADGNETAGHVSLREAICSAYTTPGADTITFSPSFFNTPRTITLDKTLGQLGLRSDLTITGPGANLLTIDGNNATRVLDVADIPDVTTLSVTISGLTITGGNAQFGAGLINRENLTLHNVVITQNTATGGTVEGGGGIYNTGTLMVTGSTISNNSVTGPGGGIENAGGSATLLSSTVSGNLSTGSGGGGIDDGTNLTVENSTISGNTAQGGIGSGNGGGLFAGGAAIVTIQNTTVSGNFASGAGGGILMLGLSLTVQNCTITQNHSDNDNSHGESGGGIANGSPTILHNTIVADNFRGSGTTTFDDIIGVMSASSTNNLIGSGGSGGLVDGTNGNQVGVTDLNMGPLADNGGPTKTHALLAGSPAIDKGNNAQLPLDAFDLDGDGNTSEPIPFDQRGLGFARIFNTTVDIGAFEFQVTFPWHNFGTLTNDVAGSRSPQPDGSVDANDVLTIINYINAHGSGPIPANAEVGLPFGFLDTDISDGSGNQIVAGDVLQVINYINAGRPQGGEAPPEGEAPANQSDINPPSQSWGSLSVDLLFLLANDVASHSAPRRVLR